MLTVETLAKSFTMHILGGQRIAGCRDVSFAVGRGEFWALAGPSGAGKSTVLKCLYRTYLPDAGRVWYDSDEFGRVDLVSAPERTIIAIRRRELGYVSQFLQVIPRVPALEVVMEPLRLSDAQQTYDIDATIEGGGVAGQAGTFRRIGDRDLRH